MIYFLVLIFFFIYSFFLFLIDNIYFLILIFIFNILVSFIVGVKLKNHFKVLKNNFLFVLFIVLCNLLFSDKIESIKVGIRLFLTIDYTYIMGNYFDSNSIRIAFKYLFYPLKIFNINIDNLTLIISISLCFIPILIDEANMIKLSLRSKGFDFSFKNVIKRPHIYLITFLNNLFDRMDELEKSLIMKAY